MFDKPKSFLSFLKALGPPPDASEPFYDHLMQHYRAGDSVYSLDIPQGLDLMVVESSKPPEAEYETLKAKLAARVGSSSNLSSLNLTHSKFFLF